MRDKQKSPKKIIHNAKEQSAENAEEFKKRVTELSTKSYYEIVLIAQKLEDNLYELGRREAKELVRSKYMRIFSHSKRKHKTK